VILLCNERLFLPTRIQWSTLRPRLMTTACNSKAHDRVSLTFCRSILRRSQLLNIQDSRRLNERWKARVSHYFAPFIPLVRALVRYGPLGLRTTLWNHIGRTRLVGLPHGFTVGTEYGRFTGDSSDMLSRYVYYFGQWEPEVTRLIKQRLGPGRTFVDVGANVGWYTLLAADAVGPTGRVVAIEASPTNFLLLQENVSNNRLKNVRLVNEAVWSTQAVLSLFQGPPHHSGISTVVPSFAERHRGCKMAAQIRARPLPELLNRDEIATLRVLKIDVEGAEREVLLGLEHMLDSAPDDLEIFLELNPTEYDVDRLLLPIRRRGFRAWVIPYQYKPEYCLSYSALQEKDTFQELLETPKQQVDVLVSRTRP
jgi:FkbM family methyltransferase